MYRFDFLGRRLAQIKTDNKKELKLIALEMSKPETRNPQPVTRLFTIHRFLKTLLNRKYLPLSQLSLQPIPGNY